MTEAVTTPSDHAPGLVDASLLTPDPAVGPALTPGPTPALALVLGPVPADASTVRPAVHDLLARPAGLGLMIAVEQLTLLDPAALTSAERVDLIAAVHRCSHRMTALAIDATTALSVTIASDAEDARADAHHHDTAGDAEGSHRRGGNRWAQLGGPVAVANHLAPALRVSPSTASKDVALAGVATRDVPTALAAMRAGQISLAHLRAVIAATRTSSDAVRAAAEAAAIRWAATLTPQQLGTQLTQLVARLDPDAHARAVEEGLTHCDVTLRRSPYAGCVRLVADLPLVHGYAVFNVVDAMARRTAATGSTGATGGAGGVGQERTLGRLRADALTGLVTSAGIREVPSGADLDADLVEVDVVTTEHATDASSTSTGREGKTGDDEDEDGPGGSGGPGGPAGPAGPGGAPSGSGGAGRPAEPAGWVRPPGWTPPAPLAPLPDLDQVRRVVVRIPLATVTGEGAHPGHLAGHGPLDAQTILHLGRVAPFRWLHADPATGHLIHREARLHPPPRPSSTARGPWTTSRSGWTSNPPEPPPLPQVITAVIRQAGYVPGVLLRAHVETRDATCIGPACHQPARTASGIQLDHTVEHARGGETTAANLGCVCRRDHQAKTHGQWQLVQDRAGVFTWTSPHGRTYEREATPLIPDWTDTDPTQR